MSTLTVLTPKGAIAMEPVTIVKVDRRQERQALDYIRTTPNRELSVREGKDLYIISPHTREGQNQVEQLRLFDPVIPGQVNKVLPIRTIDAGTPQTKTNGLTAPIVGLSTVIGFVAARSMGAAASAVGGYVIAAYIEQAKIEAENQTFKTNAEALRAFGQVIQ